MQLARHTVHGDIVCAAELRGRSGIATTTYCCSNPACAVPMHLCSFRAENKKEAYFATYPGHDHVPECPAGGLRTATAGRHGQTQGWTSGERFPYIARLIFPDDHEEDIEPPETPFTPREPNRQISATETKTATPRGDTTRTLAPIVLWYCQNPDKPHLGLAIPNGAAATYQELFRSLYFNDWTFADLLQR